MDKKPSYGTILDSRDLVDRREELEDLVEANPNNLDDDEREELAALVELLDSLGRNASDGVTLIPEDEFENYAQELASDLYGREIEQATWPFDHIDWKSAADALRVDYSSITFLGTEYLYRD